MGSTPRAHGLVVSATVKKTRTKDWYQIDLLVQKDPEKQGGDLVGPVTFHLHPTFENDKEIVQVKNGKAKLQLWAYGAFTVGVMTGDRKKLELDLSKLKDAPQYFRDN
jgi:hypothetical protein